MAFINLFLHRGSVSRRVRECIADFTALDILQPSVWLDVDDGYQGVYVAPGAQPVYGDLSTLMRRVGRQPVHIVSLNVVGRQGSAGQVDLRDVGAYHERLTQDSFTELDAASTNLVIATVGAPLDGDFPLVPGFQNLLLSPEESASPDSVSDPFTEDEEDTEEFALSVAASVCSLFGLWEGSRQLPVAVPRNTTEPLKLVRTFYRRVDGQEVQEKIRAKIFDTQNLPPIRVAKDGSSLYTVPNPDQRSVNEEAASFLLHKHGQLIEAPAVEAREENREKISASKALKTFGSFYFRQLVSWPVIFFQNMTSDLRTRVSAGIDNMLHGDGSRFRIEGLDAPVSGGGYGQQADEFPVVRQKTNSALYQGLWQDYIESALAMVDGEPRHLENRNENIKAPEYLRGSNGAIKVARKAEDVIPGPSTILSTQDFPPGLRGQLGGVELDPYDIKGVSQLEERINHLNIPGAQHGQRKFHEWKNAHDGSFAGFMGSQLVAKEQDLLAKRNGWWNEYLRLRNLQQNSVQVDRGPVVMRWLGWVVFWSMAVFAAAWGIGNAMSDDVTGLPAWRWVQFFNEASTSTKVWIFLIWFLLWLICFLTQVWKESLMIYRATTKRRKLITDIDAAKLNAYAYDRAHAQIQESYKQFLSISRVYGTVIEQPYGTIVGHTLQTEVPTNTMPPSLVIAKAEPREDVVDQFVADARGTIYTQGWLSEPVRKTLDRGVHSTTAEHGHMGGDDTTFITTWGKGSGELLDQLANSISRPEFLSSDRSAEKWNMVLDLLGSESTGPRAQMLADPVVYSNGQRLSADSSSSLERDQKRGAFNGRFIQRAGAADANAGVIADSTYMHLSHEHDSVGMSELVVQYGSGTDHQVLVLDRKGPAAAAPQYGTGQISTPPPGMTPPGGDAPIRMPGMDGV